jgi:hypothetical protein
MPNFYVRVSMSIKIAGKLSFAFDCAENLRRKVTYSVLEELHCLFKNTLKDLKRLMDLLAKISLLIIDYFL